MVLMAGQPDRNILFRHRVGDRVFELDSRDFRAADIDVASPIGLAILREGANIGEVVRALNALGVTPRDLIGIMQAIKAAGALQAELTII